MVEPIGALAIMTVSIWLVVCGIAVYGPWVISKVEPLARQWLQSGLLGGWLVASLTGVLAGQRDLSNAGRWAKRLIPPLVKITPYIFVVGLLLLLAVTIDWLLLTWFQASDVLVGSQLGAIVDSGSRLIPTDPYWHRLNQLGGFTLLGLALGAGVFALLLSMRIGVNDFSCTPVTATAWCAPTSGPATPAAIHILSPVSTPTTHATACTNCAPAADTRAPTWW